jgi:hypothetical protein
VEIPNAIGVTMQISDMGMVYSNPEKIVQSQFQI